MAFVPLHSYFPDLAERETRSVTVLGSGGGDLLPGDYGFVEMFCNDAGCDCRRVLFLVIGEFHEKPFATIGWGWEGREFYEAWSASKDPSVIEGMMGPELNPGGHQSDLAPAILQLVQETLLADEAYVERIKQHYAMMRAHLDSRRGLGLERLFGKGLAKRRSSPNSETAKGTAGDRDVYSCPGPPWQMAACRSRRAVR